MRQALDKTVKRLDPIVKWAGGKRWLAPALQQMRRISGERIMVEPFAGGMAVSLQDVSCELTIINDLNRHLINLYTTLSRNEFPSDFDWTNTGKRYYAVRDEFNARIEKQEDEGPEVAAIFLYLNRNGYNGLCRYNKSGGYNVPYGKYKRTWRPSEDVLRAFAGLYNWHFSALDFRRCLVPENAFVYSDPPFFDVFNTYQAGGFSWSDHEDLAEWGMKLDGVSHVVSNSWSDQTTDLYASNFYQVIPVEAPRRISCTGDRTAAIEMLAWRNIPELNKILPRIEKYVYTADEIEERLSLCQAS